MLSKSYVTCISCIVGLIWYIKGWFYENTSFKCLRIYLYAKPLNLPGARAWKVWFKFYTSCFQFQI